MENYEFNKVNVVEETVGRGLGSGLHGLAGIAIGCGLTLVSIAAVKGIQIGGRKLKAMWDDRKAQERVIDDDYFDEEVIDEEEDI